MRKRCQIPTNSSKAAESSPFTCSTVIECLQFGSAFLTESPQRIDGVTVHQLAKLGKALVGCEVRVDDQMNDRLRFFDHGGARYDPHPADQRVYADQCRN